jgi:hypothetical protein
MCLAVAGQVRQATDQLRLSARAGLGVDALHVGARGIAADAELLGGLEQPGTVENEIQELFFRGRQLVELGNLPAIGGRGVRFCLGILDDTAATRLWRPARSQ